jgi:hypothetical protein
MLAVQSLSLSLPTIQLSRRALHLGMLMPEFLESTPAQARHSVCICCHSYVVRDWREKITAYVIFSRAYVRTYATPGIVS